ncbi:MAG: DUF5694 domain-containing protein [Gemmatimonadales bacterium]
MSTRTFPFLMTLTVLATPLRAQTGFDPRDYQSRVAGPATEVLVLGTTHLSGLDASWNPATLAPILDRLAAWDPDLIAIENIDGMTLEAGWDQRAYRGETALRYGRVSMLAGVAGRLGTGLGTAEAARAARTRLDEWPVAPTPADRRHLAALFATAGDPYSALVQWRSLSPDERITGDGVRRDLRNLLDRLLDQRNESNLIATVLASRLGLARVHAMDSQGESTLSEAEFEVFAKQLFPAIGTRFTAEPKLVRLDSLTRRMATAAEALEAYRLLNDPALAVLRSDVEWLGMIDHAQRAEIGRKRVAGWEARNLRMAANIREASAEAMGGRVLVIVGAAHKAWLEAYLGMMSDMRIVDALAVLG